MNKTVAIQTLDLTGEILDSRSIMKLLKDATCRTLTSLSLSNTNLTTELLNFVLITRHLHQLRSLDLRQNPRLDGVSAEAVITLNSRVFDAQKTAPREVCQIMVDWDMTTIQRVCDAVKAELGKDPSCVRFVSSSVIK